MPSINLAPGTQYIMQARKRRRRLLGISIVIVVIVAVVWIGLTFYRQRLETELADIDGQIRNVELEIARIEPNANRIVLFEERLKALDGLLNQHISWNIILQDIERLLPPNTALTTVEAEADTGEINIKGITQNIDQVAVTLASLLNSTDHQTVFISGNLNSINRNQVTAIEDEAPAQIEYTFTAELRFDPAIIRNGS